MNALRIDRINHQAPYEVLLRKDNPDDYYFKTDFGIEFKVSIKEDYSIVPSGAYALGIVNASHKPSPGDAKFRLTLMAILSRLDNPLLSVVVEEFDETISLLFD